MFWPDHMDDPLAWVRDAEQLDAMPARVGAEVGDHLGNGRIGNGLMASTCRDIMVGNAEGEARLCYIQTLASDLAERVVRAFMHKVSIDPKQRIAGRAGCDRVVIPDLVEERAGRWHV